MPAKIARSSPRRSFGLPELLVATHISRPGFQGRSLLSLLVSESSGECRMRAARRDRRLHVGMG
jgi:hypothetical protein